MGNHSELFAFLVRFLSCVLWHNIWNSHSIACRPTDVRLHRRSPSLLRTLSPRKPLTGAAIRVHAHLPDLFDRHDLAVSLRSSDYTASWSPFDSEGGVSVDTCALVVAAKQRMASQSERLKFATEAERLPVWTSFRWNLPSRHLNMRRVCRRNILCSVSRDWPVSGCCARAPSRDG